MGNNERELLEIFRQMPLSAQANWLVEGRFVISVVKEATEAARREMAAQLAGLAAQIGGTGGEKRPA